MTPLHRFRTDVGRATRFYYSRSWSLGTSRSSIGDSRWYSACWATEGCCTARNYGDIWT